MGDTDSTITVDNFIAGRFQPPAGNTWLDDIEPAAGRACAKVADSDARDIDAAVAAAREAFPAWSRTPVSQRCAVLSRIADFIQRDLEPLARAESVDNGKPISLARVLDIPRAAANFRHFAGAAVHFHSESHMSDMPGAEALNYTLRQPCGVAGIISPWNLPLYLLTWKIAPALAMGNTVVAKPSELTPITAQMLCRLCQEADLPPGVLNVVHGLGHKAGAALVAHPDVPLISFTGGTATGAEIARVAGPMFKKIALECGGKNPNIVFADADLDQAVQGSVKSSFANQGQVCLCGSRIYVEQPIYQSFLDRLTAAARDIAIGDPLDESTRHGAQISAAHLEKITGYVKLARQEGGHIECGGQAPERLPERCRDGYFFEPTVITGLPPECRVNREEIFGPVVTVTPFESSRQVVEWANNTEYGLSASVWTRDIAKAHRVAADIQAGTVWINCWLVRDLRVPFGGMKHSGTGREGGLEALRFFTEPKNVCVRTPPTG